MTMDMVCGAVLPMWDGEYEGECKEPAGHDGRHNDGSYTWLGETWWPDHDSIVNLAEEG